MRSSQVFRSRNEMTASEYVKVVSGKTNVFGIQDYRMVTPVIPALEKLKGFSTPRRDV